MEITIRTVPNGFVISAQSTPTSTGGGWETPIVAVYNNLSDLQAALPKLLEVEVAQGAQVVNTTVPLPPSA